MVSSRPSRHRCRRRSNQISSSWSSSRASSSSASSSFPLQQQIECPPPKNTKHTKWKNKKKRRGRFSLSIEQQKQQQISDDADNTDSYEENYSTMLGRGSCILRRPNNDKRLWRQKEKRGKEGAFSGGRLEYPKPVCFKFFSIRKQRYPLGRPRLSFTLF